MRVQNATLKNKKIKTLVHHSIEVCALIRPLVSSNSRAS